MQQAQDTFVTDLADGTVMRVTKGDYLPESHELVKRDQDGSGTLFRRAYIDDDPKAKPSAKAADKPKAAS